MTDLEAMVELLNNKYSGHWETIGLKTILFFIQKTKENEGEWETCEINGGDLVELECQWFNEAVEYIKENHGNTD